MKVDQDTKETQERRDTEDEEAVVGKSFTDQSLSEPRNHHQHNKQQGDENISFITRKPNIDTLIC